MQTSRMRELVDQLNRASVLYYTQGASPHERRGMGTRNTTN